VPVPPPTVPDPYDISTAAAAAAAAPTGRFARRTAGMTASEIRALFAVASRPEVVSLAGGMPNLAALPLDTLAAEVGQLVASEGQTALQYGSAQGTPALREQICEVMRLEGIPASAGALGSCPAYRARVVHVAMGARGLGPQSLRNALESLARQGITPKFLYTIPNFHNPAGVTLAVERRTEILEICVSHGVAVVEDNPYGLLGFSGTVYPALRSFDRDVVYLGSFSKTFASGLRVGWALVPPAVRDRMVLAAESATLCPPTFNQMIVSRYLQTQDWRSQVKTFTAAYRERRDAMLAALETHLPPGCSWNVPDGGFYVWLTVPEGVDTKAMLPRAVTARVAYASGTGFYADGFGSRQLRLSYCYPTPERIEEGVRRLAGVLGAELDVMRTFGVPARTPRLRSGPDAPSPDTA